MHFPGWVWPLKMRINSAGHALNQPITPSPLPKLERAADRKIRYLFPVLWMASCFPASIIGLLGNLLDLPPLMNFNDVLSFKSQTCSCRAYAYCFDISVLKSLKHVFTLLAFHILRLFHLPCIAISTPAFWTVPHFHVPHFQSPRLTSWRKIRKSSLRAGPSPADSAPWWRATVSQGCTLIGPGVRYRLLWSTPPPPVVSPVRYGTRS